MKKILIAKGAVMFIATAKTNAQTTLKIGDPYLGGIIAYILTPADPGYDPTKQHGLLASKADMKQGTVSQFVWCPNNSVTNATMDGFVCRDGQCLFDLSGLSRSEHRGKSLY